VAEVLDASPDVIVAVDPSGRIVFANRAVEAVFGWSPRELVGLSVEELIPRPLGERHAAMRRAFLTAGRNRPMGIGLDLKARHRDGREFPVEVGLTTVETADGPLTFATVVDITARKALAAQLERTSQELRQSVADLERQRQEMALLAQLGSRLDACGSLEEAHAVLAEDTPSLFGGDAGALYVPAGGRLETVVSWGDPAPRSRAFAPGECHALSRGRSHVVDERGGAARCAHVGEAVGAGLVCVPLLAQGETLGLLHVQLRREVGGARHGAYLAARRRLIEMFAEHVALALVNIQLRATLRERSVRDELTGLFNRRYMEETLDREVRRATREGGSVGLIMADVDHFKAYNDTLGHAAGDDVLRMIGALLAESVRGEDVVCRFGGEEFVIILPKARPEDTRLRAEELRERLADRTSAASASGLPEVTLSLGVAAFPDHGEDGERLLSAADEALYRAKAAGRDRVEVARGASV
jgi:diguanylate cyclase (GGDEF)-like protein/PAS domain S-box-containing protein